MADNNPMHDKITVVNNPNLTLHRIYGSRNRNDGCGITNPKYAIPYA